MSKNTDLGNLVNGLFVSSTRNVGIGMTAPANAVVVDKGTATASYLQFTAGTTTGQLATDGFEVGIDASGNGIISQQENLPLMIYTNSAERLRITAAGNVGIGTTNPSQLLEVNGSSETLGISMNIRNSFDGADSTKYSGINFLMGSDNGTSAIRAYRTNSAADFQTNLTFWTKGTGAGATSPTERMRITSGGNVGIGTTSPAHKLDISNAGSTSLRLNNTANSTDSFIQYDNTSSSFSVGVGANGWFFYTSQTKRYDFWIANVIQMQLVSNGNLLLGTTTDNGYKLNLNGQPGANGYTLWTNYSDRRLKENIQPLVNTSILSKINSLNPVTFNYNQASGYDEETRARKVSGFIAQELKEIFPEMVGTLKLNNEEYFDTNLSNLSLYLVKAIQELSAEVQLLKNK